MNILIIHSIYSNKGGEEGVVELQKEMLEEKGHRVYLYTRDYKEMKSWLFGKVGGMFTSVYNSRSIRDIKIIIKQFKPDIAIIHNLLPIISPCIIPFLKKRNIKTYQIIHNYRLFCPIGIFYTKNSICEECTKGIMELNCLKRQCVGGFFSSFSFALRGLLIRVLGYYKSVDLYFVLSEFQKQKLITNGYKEDKIKVLPNCYRPNEESEKDKIDLYKKEYISFVGRLTREKGFFDFIEVAKKLPEHKFRVAGEKTNIINDISIPDNVEFTGFLNKEQLSQFYKESKVVLFLSKWYETFGLVLLEALYYGIPVVAYDIASVSQIIEDNKQGYICNISDLDCICQKIEYLLSDEDNYIRLSNNARAKYDKKYTTNKYYETLMSYVQS